MSFGRALAWGACGDWVGFVEGVEFALGSDVKSSGETGLEEVLLALTLVLVFAFSLSWIWIAVGLLVDTPESVMTMSFLLLFPLTFVSNIFVDPTTMPSWLQTVVSVNPVTHLVDASRGLMHGGVALTDVMWVLLASAVIVAVFAPLSLHLYHRER